MMMGVMETVNEYYSANLAREVRKGMMENALKCMATGGVAPFGLKVDPETKRYVINDDEAPAIIHIFDGVKNGKGYNQIIKEINDLGYRTRLGKPFGKNSIHEILRNEKYKGVFIYNRSSSKDKRGKRNNHQNKYDEEIIRIEGGIDAIVDTETFDMVTKIIGSRRHTHATGSHAKETYLLSGKIFCGNCGAAYVGSRKHSGRNKIIHVTYRCGSRTMKAGIDCKNKEIRREYIEDFVMRELARVIFSPETIDEIINNYAEFSKENDTIEFEKQETLRKNIASVKQKITNIINIMATSGSNSLIEALEELETEKKKLETTLAKRQTGTTAACIDEDKIRKAYQLAREQFLNGTLVEKQALIFQYVNKVLIFDEYVEVYLNRLPMHLTRITELDFNHPTSGTKKHRNRAIFDSVADWVGGGEGI